MRDQTIAALEEENRRLRELLEPFDFQLTNPLVDAQCLCDRLELQHVNAVSEYLHRDIRTASRSDHSGDADKMVATPQEAEPVALLPCPFCGDADHLRRSHITGGIFCENCGCDGPSSPFWDGDWNTRPTTLAPPPESQSKPTRRCRL